MFFSGNRYLNLLAPLLLALLPGAVEADDWQLVLTDPTMEMETFVQRQGKLQDGKIDVLVKNSCTGQNACWVNTMYKFCKYWGCEADEYVGDKRKQPPARYEIKAGSVDCGNKTFMLRRHTWYAADGAVLAKDVVEKPVYTKPDSEASVDETEKMMGRIFEIDDVIAHVCR